MELPTQSTLVPPTPSSPPPTVESLPRKSPLKMILIIILILAIVGGGLYFLLTSGLLKGKSAEPTTLTWWGLWEDEAVVKPLIDAYEADHPDVKINYIFQSQREYRERLQNALSQGSGPDIFRLHNTWIPMFKDDLAPIPAEVYSAQSFESTFFPTAKVDLRVGNSYMAVPLEFDGLAMYINEDLFSSSGKNVPQSWVELRDTAKDLAVCDTEDGKCRPGDRILIAGASLGTVDNVDHWQDVIAVLMLQNNVNLNAPSGKPAEDVLDYYTKFTLADGTWDSTLPNSTTAFANGKLAIYFGPSWRVFEIKSINPNLNFKVYPVPQLPVDPALGEKPVTWASYWAEGVNVKSANVAKAWDFVGWLSQKETLQKFYQQATLSGRAFGEPYPRQDMASLVTNDPYVGAYVSQAPNAKSWYLTSFTWDGQTGINSRISQYFADAINGINQGKSLGEAVKTLSNGVNQVLSQYGLAAQAPVAQ